MTSLFDELADMVRAHAAIYRQPAAVEDKDSGQLSQKGALVTHPHMSIGYTASKRSNAASNGATKSARKLQCPACHRKAALGIKAEWDNGDWARNCRYCGHIVGRTDGVYYGRGD